MNNFLLLLKKELWESWANSKIVIVASALAIVSILGPYFKLQPYYSRFVVQGLTGSLLVSDFYIYLQLLLFIFIPFMVMGTVASEVKNSTTASLLVKPVGRAGYIISKYLAYMLVFGVATIIATLLSAVYANALAPEADAFGKIWGTLGLSLVFISFAVSFVIFVSTITKQQIIAGISGLFVLMLSFVFQYVENVNKFLPTSLFLWIQNILVPPMVQNTYDPSPAWLAFIISIVASFVFILASTLIIKRREL
ncbi:MAG: ABC transporter permease [Dehalococcoidia bacterium]|nr:ABC transporter permease [Dehalococcoidia bacterium]